MDVRQVVAVIAVVCFGLLAGLLVGTGMASATAKGLPEASWTLRFQAEDALFAKVMPPTVLVALALLVASAVVAHGAARGFFAAAALLMLFVLVFTVAREVPLNKEIQSWTAGSAPANWTAVRDRWLLNHAVRSVAGVLGFVCAVLGLVTL